MKTINDFLEANGYPMLDRPLEKSTMKVKEFDSVKWGKHKPYPCIGMEKIDGVNCMCLIINQKAMMFTREGKRMKNVLHLEAFINYKAGVYGVDCMVLNFELFNRELALTELSGIVNPNRVNALDPEVESKFRNSTEMMLFDCFTLDEFIDGEGYLPFHQRLIDCVTLADYLGMHVPQYTTLHDEEESEVFFKFITSNPKAEGTVQCLPNFPWVAGYKNHAKTKKVRGYDIDLEVVDVIEGKGKRAGTMAKLRVFWRAYGKPDGTPTWLDVDGRFTDEFRAECWANPESIIGSIVHVHGLKVDSKGAIRLPKIHSVRIDKEVADI